MGNIFDDAARNDRKIKTETAKKARDADSTRTANSSQSPSQRRYGGRKKVLFGIDADVDERLRVFRFETGMTVTDVINDALRRYLK